MSESADLAAFHTHAHTLTADSAAFHTHARTLTAELAAFHTHARTLTADSVACSQKVSKLHFKYLPYVVQTIE